MTDALKSCPFCGSEDVHLNDASFDMEISCFHCGANIEEFPTKESLIAAWNRRADPPEVSDDDTD